MKVVVLTREIDTQCQVFSDKWLAVRTAISQISEMDDKDVECNVKELINNGDYNEALDAYNASVKLEDQFIIRVCEVLNVVV